MSPGNPVRERARGVESFIPPTVCIECRPFFVPLLPVFESCIPSIISGARLILHYAYNILSLSFSNLQDWNCSLDRGVRLRCLEAVRYGIARTAKARSGIGC